MMDSTTAKRARLVDALHSKTFEGSLTWDVRADLDMISAGIGDRRVFIQPKPSGFGDIPDYEVSIMDAKGNTVEIFSDVDLKDSGAIINSGDSAFMSIDETFKYANRKYSGAEDALDDILGVLES